MVCHSCRVDCGRYGRDRYGHQRYRCRQCSKTFLEPREKPLEGMYLPTARAKMILKMLCEGVSVRSIERLSETHRDTILRLLVVAGEKCERLLSDRIRGLTVSDVQCDEIWGYVWCKEKNRPTDSPFIGDAYCFMAVERNTKLILAWHLGRRTAQHTMEFTEKLRVATRGDFQVSTDGWPPYRDCIPYSLGARADFATVVKIYQSNRESEARYAPPEVGATIITPIHGRPNLDKACTSHVERQNLSIRMGMRRMTRLTNAYSKKWQNLKAAYALWFAYYDFCRVHQTLRVTPAMEAGIADHVWEIGELLTAA
jgi:transposase-like protein/IS1 family transposase